MQRSLLMIIGIAPMILNAGCGGAPQSNYSHVQLVDAAGTIKLDGQPLSKAVVTFETEDGQFSYGMTDASGNYKLQFDSVKNGVVPGKKIVRISTTRKIPGLKEIEPAKDPEESPEDAGAAADGSQERVPLRYNKASELKIDVTGDQKRYDFDLASR